MVETDNEGKVQLDRDGNEIKLHRYVKSFEEYLEQVSKYKHNYYIYNALATVRPDEKGELRRREANLQKQRDKRNK